MDFNIPLAQEISVFLTTCIDFLGITINVLNMKIRLPKVKIIRSKFLPFNFIRTKKVKRSSLFWVS